MSNAAAIVLMFVLPLLFLGAVCAYGPLVADPLRDRRLARCRTAEREAVPARPRPTARLRQPGWPLEQWTPAGWAPVPARVA